MNSKQVIVIRKDIKISHKKLGVQMAHASNCAFRSIGEMNNTGENLNFSINYKKDDALDVWLKSGETKICLWAKNQNQMEKIYQKALDAGLPCSIIVDEGRTEFKEPTMTTLAIGPAFNNEIDPITKRLQLAKDD